MRSIVQRWLGASLLVAVAVVVSTACTSDIPVGPDLESEAGLNMVGTLASAPNDLRVPNLGSCQFLQAPAETRVAARLYANGVQIYTWNGTSWTFVAPLAVLSADAMGNSIVGTHYAGPTWESRSGGTVVGGVLDRCTPNADAIPWLLLGVSSDGPGIFHGVTHIQRVNTAGGNAPAEVGSVVGQEERVPYTAEYVFYR